MNIDSTLTTGERIATWAQPSIPMDPVALPAVTRRAYVIEEGHRPVISAERRGGKLVVSKVIA